MLNAAEMGADLLEIRLDGFDNDPDPKELLSARRKPVIFSCRRRADGGNWKGSEEERILLLKTAIVSPPDYCQLEIDVADQIRRFGPCQLVITYTNLKQAPTDILTSSAPPAAASASSSPPHCSTRTSRT